MEGMNGAEPTASARNNRRLPVLMAIAAMLIILTDRWTCFAAEQQAYLFVHSMLEMICVAIAFSIVLRSRLTLPQTISGRAMSIGAVFLGIGMLDTLHVLTCQGMPLFDAAPGSSTWMESLLFGYGFLAGIYMTAVKEPSMKQKQSEAHLSEHQRQIEASEARYRHLALHDELTGLPNRRWFMEAMNEAIEHARESGVALLLFDIDRFKSINDTMGHTFGDSLLRAVAAKLERFSAERGMLARLGGDEFAILLSIRTGPAEIRQYAHLLMEELGAPCRINEQEFRMSGSIGIARYPDDSDSPETMLKHAEIAMYRAKERRSKVEWYTPDMQLNKETVALEYELRQAIDREQFILHYQPRIRIDRQTVTGAEALIRWNHPRRGFIPPSRFIPVAEETGMIVPIGEWVLRTACRQWAQWRQEGLAPPSIAVNLSGVQFNEGGLVETVGRIMRETGIPPGALVLEITESIAMDIGLATAKINQLKALGVSIDIDDFGTGYSSLSYLKRLPIDRLKIDRSFIRDLTTDPGDAAIIASITAMAHHMNIMVVAEGVETEAQLAYLKDHDCDEAQGFWFSPPVPAQAFSAFMLHTRGNLG